MVGFAFYFLEKVFYWDTLIGYPDKEFIFNGGESTLKCTDISCSVFFIITRSYAALRAADLDWIVGPGYSSGRYILKKKHEKPTWNHEKP